jgi:hypothetical protein
LSKAVHATCIREEAQNYDTVIRVRRLYDILQRELSSQATRLTYLDPSEQGSAATAPEGKGTSL